MDKGDFRERLFRAVDAAKRLAAQFVTDDLPEPDLIWLPPMANPGGTPAPDGLLKFLGGRLLEPGELEAVRLPRAAELLWVDGRVPRWINIRVERVDADGTHLRVGFGGGLVLADVATLPPDIGEPRGNEFVPFRIRGPILPKGWRDVRASGKFSIRATAD